MLSEKNQNSDSHFALANSFLKKYPTVETSKGNITFDLISSIIIYHIKNIHII